MKKGLPQALAPTGGQRKKPILTYRISGKDLAEAVERKRRSQRRRSSTADTLDEDFFRDVTLTDSSILWADSDADSIPCSQSSSVDCQDRQDRLDRLGPRNGPPAEASRKSWRSPEEERRKRMLEQRKQQWRASKAAEGGLPLLAPASATPPSFRSLSIRTADGGASLAPPSVTSWNSSTASCRSVSPRVSRRVSRRCPELGHDGATPIRPPSGGELRSKSLSASGATPTPVRAPPQSLVKFGDDMPWQWRNRPQRPLDAIRSQLLPHPVTLKKFGHHVGPSRNPDCGCVHCVEFHRARNHQNC